MSKEDDPVIRSINFLQDISLYRMNDTCEQLTFPHVLTYRLQPIKEARNRRFYVSQVRLMDNLRIVVRMGRSKM